MSIRRFVVAVLWIAALVAVAEVVNAQTRRMVPLAQPIILSGSNVGFRIEGQVGDRPAGVLVIRVAGECVVPTTSEGPARLASR